MYAMNCIAFVLSYTQQQIKKLEWTKIEIIMIMLIIIIIYYHTH